MLGLNLNTNLNLNVNATPEEAEKLIKKHKRKGLIILGVILIASLLLGFYLFFSAPKVSPYAGIKAGIAITNATGTPNITINDMTVDGDFPGIYMDNVENPKLKVDGYRQNSKENDD